MWFHVVLANLKTRCASPQSIWRSGRRNRKVPGTFICSQNREGVEGIASKSPFPRDSESNLCSWWSESDPFYYKRSPQCPARNPNSPDAIKQRYFSRERFVPVHISPSNHAFRASWWWLPQNTSHVDSKPRVELPSLQRSQQLLLHRNRKYARPGDQVIFSCCIDH